MKNIIKVLFVFAFGFLFISNVEAYGVELDLDCKPKTATYYQTVTCDVSATVSGRTLTRMTLTPNKSGPVSIVPSELTNTNIPTGTNNDLGSIVLKTQGYSGNATISLRATDIWFGTSHETNDEKVYEYITVKSNVNTLSSIKIDGVLVAGFSKEKTSYQASTIKDTVAIGATKTSSQATLTGTGTKSLKCGSNVFSLKVTSDYGTSKNYTVGINRKCDSNVYLSGITLSKGKLDPEFVKTTTNYTVKVDKTVKTISVSGQKSSNTQTVAGNVNNQVLKFGSNKISITVTNQTGAKQVYTINVIKEDNRDKNTLLSSLSLSDGNIDFDKNTFEYETKVLYSVNKIELLAIPEQKTSKVTIKGADNLKVGENNITIEVKAESGKKQIYTVKVTRLKEGETLGNNANIKNIIIKGHNLKFDYKKIEYKLILEKEESLDITVIMEDPTATYQIIGNKDLKDNSVIKIVTKASDGTSKTYTINITKPSYTIYYILGAVFIGLVITIPAIVYFRSVKVKKVKKDVNGYEMGKDYEDTTKERQVMDKQIVTVPNVVTDVEEKQEIEQPQPKKSIVSKKKNKNLKLETPLKSPKTNNEQTTDKNGFDTELQDYVPNVEGKKCPHCGRELLEDTKNCPYCKKTIN